MIFKLIFYEQDIRNNLLNNWQCIESSIKIIWKWNINYNVNKSIVNNDSDDDTIKISNEKEKSNIKSKELNQYYNLLAFKLK